MSGSKKPRDATSANAQEMPPARIPFQIYRSSSIGVTLRDSLDEFQALNLMTPQLNEKLLLTFDSVMTRMLADMVHANMTFKGHLDTYRFLDEVWFFDVKDVTFKLKDPQLVVEARKVKILAHNAHPAA